MTDRMYDSADQFAQALNTLVDQAQDHASEIIRKAGIDTTQNIQDDTPHDTRRAQSGWHFDSRFDESEVPPEGQKSYTPERIADPGHASNWVWEIFNNVEYISVLNDGHSQQAPHGMVEVNLQAFADHVKQYAKQDDFWEST
jgi:hypothetical protein